VKTPIKLSPSDLTFLWDECKRCFYLKYVYGITRPAAPFPAIFGTIDRLMKEYYEGRPTADLDPALPAGRVRFGEKWVESVPVTLPGHDVQCYIKGKIDTVVAFDDGSFGVVDFKTSEPKPSHVHFYSRQLHAYTYALEHPGAGKFSLSPISELGLLVVSPNAMDVTVSGQIAYLGGVTWMEIPRDDAGFLQFLGEVLTLLEQPSPPEPGETCAYCQYREHARQHGM
jgi:CRISPR/Cas system-associated exonuclease Cas4 (RecB family)